MSWISRRPDSLPGNPEAPVEVQGFRPSTYQRRATAGTTLSGVSAAGSGLETGLVGRGVQQVGRAAVVGGDLEEPPVSVGVGVDQLGGGVEGLVAGHPPPADRRVDLTDRLGGLELADDGTRGD